MGGDIGEEVGWLCWVGLYPVGEAVFNFFWGEFCSDNYFCKLGAVNCVIWFERTVFIALNDSANLEEGERVVIFAINGDICEFRG